jgi:tight adherence protein B
MQRGGYALVGLGIAFAVYILFAATDSPLHSAFRSYSQTLEKQCRLLYLRTTGEQIARRQLLGIALFVVATLFTLQLVFLALALAAAVIPRIWLSSKVDERRKAIDGQLDAFLTTLSNALRASPSLGDALATTANLMRAPIKDDLEFALKENRLGTPLDQALLNMSNRIESRAFNSALSTILIGRQTGGDLPKILERSAATLREMARLEGVVRSKTAEGKAQAYVLGAVPFVIIVVLNSVDADWLKPLTSTFIGYVIIGGAAVMWIGAIIAARRILNVDV